MSRKSMMMSFVALAALAAFAAAPGQAQEATVAKSLHELEVKTLEGQPKKLSEFEGKVLLVVNVASECGLTPQYRGLQALHDRFKERGFSVLGFPSNEFGGQEPGDAKTIRTFCETNYKVTFPLFEKVETKEGAGQSPVYRALKAATNELPGWNFGKYLVDKEGKPVKYFGPRTAPDAKELVDAIEAAVGPTK